MFTDGRSKKVIFLAHCLLNQNAISDGTAVYPAAFRELIQLLLDRAQAGEDVSSLLLPVDSMFESSPPVRLTPRQERACRCGAAFSVALAPGTYRLYGASEFLALGRCDGTRMQTIKSFFEV